MLLILLLTQNIFAQGDGASDGSSDGGQNVDYNNPTELATAIEQGKISDFSKITTENLVSALDSRPSISRELPDIDLVRALNQNPSLLQISPGLNQIFIDVSQRTQTDPNILNDNPDIKKVWFNGFGIKDEGAGISSYVIDNQQITIKGTAQGKEEVRTTFVLSDVPSKSRVLADGTLVTNIGNFKDTAEISKQRDANGQPIQIDGVDIYSVTGGVIEVDVDAEKANFVTSCTDASRDSCTTLKSMIPKYAKYVLYRGSFRFTQTTEGVEVVQEGDRPFSRASTKNLITHEITGGIFEHREKNNVINLEEFFLLDKTTVTKGLGLTTITYETDTPGNRLYYSEQQKAVCPPKFSCLFNTPSPSNNELYRRGLIFKNVKNTDTVTVSSASYYDKVKGDHLEGGKAVFRSLEKVRDDLGDIVSGDKVLSEITMSDRDQISITNGKIVDTNVGRIDLLYNDGTEEKMTHWSSNKGYKEDKEGRSSVEIYFKDRVNTFVTCSVEVDCEEKFAESFGKIILGQDKSQRPKTTIIIGGDNPSTAQTEVCQKDGCYILNSRDAPPTTGSDTIILGGHHLMLGEGVSRSALGTPEGTPRLIDRYTVDEFPLPRKGVVVRAFKNSACNSNLEPWQNPSNKKQYLLIDLYSAALLQKYPHAIIEGWHGTAPLEESIDKIVYDEGMIQQNCFTTAKGKRTWVFKDAQGETLWTDCQKTITISH